MYLKEKERKKVWEKFIANKREAIAYKADGRFISSVIGKSVGVLQDKFPNLTV